MPLQLVIASISRSFYSFHGSSQASRVLPLGSMETRPQQSTKDANQPRNCKTLIFFLWMLVAVRDRSRLANKTKNYTTTVAQFRTKIYISTKSAVQGAPLYFDCNTLTICAMYFFLLYSIMLQHVYVICICKKTHFQHICIVRVSSSNNTACSFSRFSLKSLS